MKSKNNNVEIFLERASSILNISKSRVEEIFRPNELKAFRLNGFNFNRDEVIAELKGNGVDIKPISWYEDGFTFPAEQTALVTESLAFKNGDIFIQNPSSWLPILLMDFSPGQTIIDMCSSPGGKAMHIATITGELPIMVEVKQHRFNRLVQSLNESGFAIDKTDPKLLNADGKHLPNLYPDMLADIVMVDAECSNEAGINYADKSDPLKGWSMKRVEKCSRLQIQLLTSAYKLTKPGGQIIYSTCTLAPEENEMVVKEVIKRMASKGGELTPVISKAWPWSNDGVVTRIVPGTDNVMDGFCVTKLVRNS